MEERLQVGVISSTHGVRGEVKVFPTTDDPKRYKKLKKVYLDTGKEYLPLEIQGVKFFKQFVIVKFKGIDTLNDILEYKNKTPLVFKRREGFSIYLFDISEILSLPKESTTSSVSFVKIRLKSYAVKL